MSKRLLSLLSISAALTMLGAACAKKTTVTVNATNTSVTAPLNTALNATNTRTTGDFSTSTNTNTAAATVTITAAGVSSKTLTVTSGTVVTFVNTDTIAHQVASNPHPTHTGLPGFDNSTTSTSYNFTFTKVGSFGYHDHLDPTNSAMQGTIVVQ